MSTRDEAGARRHLVFRIGNQRYAIPADHVEEIVPESKPRALGALPPHVPGVIRLHGRWIPVVNPLPLLGIVGVAGNAAAILHRGEQMYALLVDGSDGVVMVHDDEIESDHDAIGGTRSFIEDAAGTITLFDADALFRAPAPQRVDPHARQRHATAAARVVLKFGVGPYRMAVPAECVVEVRARSSMRDPASGVPALLGFVDADAGAVPVLSVAHALGAASERTAHVIVVATPRGMLGLGADRTHGFASVAVTNTDAHPLLGSLLAPILRGVLHSAAGPLIELDLARLVDDSTWESFRAAAPVAAPTGA